MSIENQGHEKEDDIPTAHAEAAIESSDRIEKTEPISDAVAVDETENEIIVSAPSAPAIDDIDDQQPFTASPKQSAKPLYPKLADTQSAHALSTRVISRTHERIILQPFTNEQLKELYHNPELYMADAFETDFISAELNNAHKDHPLYELLKKYSHSRYNLKVNMLDLHAYIKCFQENAQKVWIIENRITSYDGVCADGERIRKNESYEYAALHEPTFQKVASTLNNTLQLVCYSFMTNLYACESYRTQVSVRNTWRFT